MKKQTFKEWMKQFKNDDTPIGDLVRDDLLDPTYPDTDSYNKIYEYLSYDQNASELHMRVFDRAWKLYEKEVS